MFNSSHVIATVNHIRQIQLCKFAIVQYCRYTCLWGDIDLLKFDCSNESDKYKTAASVMLAYIVQIEYAFCSCFAVVVKAVNTLYKFQMYE